MLSSPRSCRHAHRLRLAPWAVLFLVLVGGLLLAPTQGRAETTKPPRASALTYEKDIRPILKANCFDCHGEREKPKGGLDLRLRRLIVAGGESGPAIVPGKPKDSRLIDLVRENRNLPLPEISQNVTMAVDTWIGDKEQPDDVTLVLARAR